jgi:protein SMG6
MSHLLPHPSLMEDRAENSIFAHQLKMLYREISNLETKVKQEVSMDDTDDVMTSRVVLKGKEVENEDLEKEKWKKQLSDHKTLVFNVITSYFLSKTDIITSLAENIHNLLEISLSPSVLPSLRIIPTKYNIIVRLWTYAFHKLLESLRRAAFASPLALEHLPDFIYYAYIFYTGLLEDPTLVSFKSGWLEVLGIWLGIGWQ